MSINETLKQKIDELDLDRRADELVEQAQQALATARERAGSLADEHGDEVRTWIDRAATTIDSRTDGRWSEQVGRVREQLSTGIERLADLGGGHGLLLASVLQKYPGMQGVLFDLPEVVAGVPADRLAACGGRLRVEAGSFFDRVPQGCDAYMMKHIIHDWSDEHCRTILRLIRAELPPHGRLLVCELVMPEEPGPAPAKMLDIEMLVMTVGGKERSPSEFAELFASAGLKLGRIVTTPTPIPPET